MFYREAGQFYTTYAKDQGIFQLKQDKYGLWGLLFFAFLVVPIGLYLLVQGGVMAGTTKDYLYNSILLLLLVNCMAAMGLNILTGYCGQISLGTAAFMGVGAFTAYKFSTGMNYRVQKEDNAGELVSTLVPILPQIDNPIALILLAGAVTAIVGVLFGLPSLRIKGFYLAVATLAAQFFLVWCFSRVEWLYDYTSSSTIQIPLLKVLSFIETGTITFGMPDGSTKAVSVSGFLVAGSETLKVPDGAKTIVSASGFILTDFSKALSSPDASRAVTGETFRIYPVPETKYIFSLAIVVVFAFIMKNLVRGRIGRAWMAIRDMDIAAQLIGIRPLATKLLAFAVSSFFCGVAGAMLLIFYLGALEGAEAFNINESFSILFMVIIGGLGSITGSFLGAAFITLTPIILINVLPAISDVFQDKALVEHIQFMVFGALIILFLIMEPLGLSRLWQIAKEKLRQWPFPY